MTRLNEDVTGDPNGGGARRRDGRSATRSIEVNPALRSRSSEVMNFLNEVASRNPHAISLAAGRPPDRLLPADRVPAWIGTYVSHRATEQSTDEAAVWRQLGQYGATNGSISDLLATWLKRDEQIDVPPDGIAVTNGMQEAILIVLLGMFDRARDVLLADNPTYVGLTGAAALAGVDVQVLPPGASYPERVRRAVQAVRAQQKRARGVYVIPDFSNPFGDTRTLAERQELLALAEQEDLYLIEDTAYRSFCYDPVDHCPSLKALDRSRRTIVVGSFAKLVMPGLRCGYLIADQLTGAPGRRGPGPLLAQELSKVKSFTSVLTSPLMQAAVGGLLLEQDFQLTRWNAPRVELCRKNRDTMLRALQATFGADPDLRDVVSWRAPAGGFFLPVSLPFELETEDLLRCIQHHSVIVFPMSYFSHDGGHREWVRLSFSNASEEDITEGIQRFFSFVKATLAMRVRRVGA